MAKTFLGNLTATNAGKSVVTIAVTSEYGKTTTKTLDFKILENSITPTPGTDEEERYGWTSDLLSDDYLAAMREVKDYVILYPSDATGENILVVANLTSGYTHESWNAVETELATGNYQAAIIDNTFSDGTQNKIPTLTGNYDKVVVGENSVGVSIAGGTIGALFGGSGPAQATASSNTMPFSPCQIEANAKITNAYGANIWTLSDNAEITNLIGSAVGTIQGSAKITNVYGAFINKFLGGTIDTMYGGFIQSMGEISGASSPTISLMKCGGIATFTKGTITKMEDYAAILSLYGSATVTYKGITYPQTSADKTIVNTTWLNSGEIVLYPKDATGTFTLTVSTNYSTWEKVEDAIATKIYSKVIVKASFTKDINLTSNYTKVFIGQGRTIASASGTIGTLDSVIGVYSHSNWISQYSGVITTLESTGIVEKMNGGCISTVKRGGTVKVFNGGQIENLRGNLEIMYGGYVSAANQATIGKMYGGVIYSISERNYDGDLTGSFEYMYGGVVVNLYVCSSSPITKMYGGVIVSPNTTAGSYGKDTAGEIHVYGGRIYASSSSTNNVSVSKFNPDGVLVGTTGGPDSSRDAVNLATESKLKQDDRKSGSLSLFDVQTAVDNALKAIKSYAWPYYSSYGLNPSESEDYITIVGPGFKTAELKIGSTTLPDGNYCCPGVNGAYCGSKFAEVIAIDENAKDSFTGDFILDNTGVDYAGIIAYQCDKGHNTKVRMIRGEEPVVEENVSSQWDDDLMSLEYLAAMREISPYIILYPYSSTTAIEENILVVAKTTSGYTHANWAAVEADVETYKYKAVIVDPSYDKDDIVITGNYATIIQGETSRPITIGSTTSSASVGAYYGWCGPAEKYSTDMGKVKNVVKCTLGNIYGGFFDSIGDYAQIDYICGAYIATISENASTGFNIRGVYIQTLNNFIARWGTTNPLKSGLIGKISSTGGSQGFGNVIVNQCEGAQSFPEGYWGDGMIISPSATINYKGTAYTSICGPIYDDMKAMQSGEYIETAYLYPTNAGPDEVEFIEGTDDWTTMESGIAAGKFKKVTIKTGGAGTLTVKLTANYDRVILATGSAIHSASGNIKSLESKYGCYGNELGTMGGYIATVNKDCVIDEMKGGYIYEFAGHINNFRGGSIVNVGSMTQNVSPTYSTTLVNDSYATIKNMYGGQIAYLGGYLLHFYGGRITECRSYGGCEGAIRFMYGGYVQLMSSNTPATKSSLSNEKTAIVDKFGYCGVDYTSMYGGSIANLQCKGAIQNRQAVLLYAGKIGIILSGWATIQKSSGQTDVTSGSASQFPAHNTLVHDRQGADISVIPVIDAQNTTDKAVAATRSFSWYCDDEDIGRTRDYEFPPYITAVGPGVKRGNLQVGSSTMPNGNYNCPGTYSISLGIDGAAPAVYDCSSTSGKIVAIYEDGFFDTHYSADMPIWGASLITYDCSSYMHTPVTIRMREGAGTSDYLYVSVGNSYSCIDKLVKSVNLSGISEANATSTINIKSSSTWSFTNSNPEAFTFTKTSDTQGTVTPIKGGSGYIQFSNSSGIKRILPVTINDTSADLLPKNTEAFQTFYIYKGGTNNFYTADYNVLRSGNQSIASSNDTKTLTGIAVGETTITFGIKKLDGTILWDTNPRKLVVIEEGVLKYTKGSKFEIEVGETLDSTIVHSHNITYVASDVISYDPITNKITGVKEGTGTLTLTMKYNVIQGFSYVEGVIIYETTKNLTINVNVTAAAAPAVSADPRITVSPSLLTATVGELSPYTFRINVPAGVNLDTSDPSYTPTAIGEYSGVTSVVTFTTNTAGTTDGSTYVDWYGGITGKVEGTGNIVLATTYNGINYETKLPVKVLSAAAANANRNIVSHTSISLKVGQTMTFTLSGVDSGFYYSNINGANDNIESQDTNILTISNLTTNFGSSGLVTTATLTAKKAGTTTLKVYNAILNNNKIRGTIPVTVTA